jgi:hypothetical protein
MVAAAAAIHRLPLPGDVDLKEELGLGAAAQAKRPVVP